MLPQHASPARSSPWHSDQRSRRRPCRPGPRRTRGTGARLCTVRARARLTAAGESGNAGRQQGPHKHSFGTICPVSALLLLLECCCCVRTQASHAPAATGHKPSPASALLPAHPQAGAALEPPAGGAAGAASVRAAGGAARAEGVRLALQRRGVGGGRRSNGCWG